MPEYAVTQLERLMGNLNGKRVLVLGASYRGGVKETAFSGVFDLVKQLKRRNARVFVDDPLFAPEELDSFGLDAWLDNEQVDGLILQADHSEYKNLDPANYGNPKAIVDGRNFLQTNTEISKWAIGKTSSQ